MISRLKCLLFGHKRGKLTGVTKDAQQRDIARSFKCPRCSATWSRKVKAA